MKLCFNSLHLETVSCSSNNEIKQTTDQNIEAFQQKSIHIDLDF